MVNDVISDLKSNMDGTLESLKRDLAKRHTRSGAMPEREFQTRLTWNDVARLKVPLLVDVGVGPNWDAAH